MITTHPPPPLYAVSPNSLPSPPPSFPFPPFHPPFSLRFGKSNFFGIKPIKPCKCQMMCSVDERFKVLEMGMGDKCCRTLSLETCVPCLRGHRFSPIHPGCQQVFGAQPKCAMLVQPWVPLAEGRDFDRPWQITFIKHHRPILGFLNKLPLDYHRLRNLGNTECCDKGGYALCLNRGVHSQTSLCA